MYFNKKKVSEVDIVLQIRNNPNAGIEIKTCIILNKNITIFIR